MPPLSDSHPISFREAPLANRPPAQRTPVTPEGRGGQHMPRSPCALCVLSEHSQQCRVISYVSGPRHPLTWKIRQTFRDSNQLPDASNCNVITPFTKMQREILEAFLIRADIIPLMGHHINQSCCYDYGDGGERTPA